VPYLLDALILVAVAIVPSTPIFTVAARSSGDTVPSGRGESRAGSVKPLTVTRISPG
jgi:hypothetical protein